MKERSFFERKQLLSNLVLNFENSEQFSSSNMLRKQLPEINFLFDIKIHPDRRHERRSVLNVYIKLFRGWNNFYEVIRYNIVLHYNNLVWHMRIFFQRNANLLVTSSTRTETATGGALWKRFFKKKSQISVENTCAGIFFK